MHAHPNPGPATAGPYDLTKMLKRPADRLWSPGRSLVFIDQYGRVIVSLGFG